MWGIIDAGNWQSLIDMRTGKPIETSGEDFTALRALAANNPYPGDLSDQGINWVSAASQAIVNLHNPDWMLLTYVQPYFIEMFEPPDQIKSEQRQKRIINDILDFAARNSFEPLIVAACEYVPLQGYITQPETKGILESFPWGFSMAGISNAAPEDEEILISHPLIEQVVPRARVLATYPDLHPSFKEYFPDYVVIAKEGYAFRGLNYHHGQLYMADTFAKTLPLYSTIGYPQHVRGIRGLMDGALEGGKKVLLAVMEGYRKGSLPAEFKICSNVDDWYSYRGMQLYRTLHTGIPFFESEDPPIFNRIRKPSTKDYPLSGFANSNPEDSITAKAGVRSAAVSSRGMVPQTISNADINFESYCRDLSNMGVLVAFKPEKFQGA